MSNRATIRVLNNLMELCLASEKGFNVTATNVANRGLKLLLKTYAQQRSEFFEALRRAVWVQGGRARVGPKPLAAFHRGWINIKATLTIGAPNTEQVVLNEASRGEKVALRNYEKALRKELPSEVHTLVEEQYRHILEVQQQIELLNGQSGRQLVVRLFDTSDDADKAIDALRGAGFSQEMIDEIPLNQVVELYEQKHKDRPIVESAAAGALIVAILGAFIGLVAALSAAVIPTVSSIAAQNIMGLAVETGGAGLIIGALVGAFLGALIGLGVAEDDTYLYIESVRQGKLLLMVRTVSERADDAGQIMMAVNAARERISFGSG